MFPSRSGRTRSLFESPRAFHVPHPCRRTDSSVTRSPVNSGNLLSRSVAGGCSRFGMQMGPFAGARWPAHDLHDQAQNSHSPGGSHPVRVTSSGRQPLPFRCLCLLRTSGHHALPPEGVDLPIDGFCPRLRGPAFGCSSAGARLPPNLSLPSQEVRSCRICP